MTKPPVPHAFEVQVVDPNDLLAMLVTPRSLPTARLVGNWLAQALRRKPNDRALCLNCDAEFQGEHSWSVMVAAPFARDGEAIVSGICPECAQHPNLETIILDRLRVVIPDLQTIKPGSG
jgi:hypothetical protein